MARPERYFVGPNMRDQLRDVVTRVAGTPIGGGNADIPTRLQELPRPADGPSVRLGKPMTTWLKGTLATVEVYEEGTPPNESVKLPTSELIENCVNKFASVAVGKWVMIAKAGNGSWYLIAAECG